MSQQPDQKTRVVIYGSCVSRDTFEYLDQDAFQLDRYIARQSLISAYAEPTSLDDTDLGRLASEFQKRMVRDDFSSSLHRNLIEFGAEADVLLWDLTDERFGVWDLGHGQFVTRSVELITSGLDARLEHDAVLIPFGSKRHLTLWTEAFAQFSATVREAGFGGTPVLVAPDWAARDELGTRVRSPLGPETRTANRILRRYFQQAGSVRKVTTRTRRPQADSTHRWGPAPYHYLSQVYEDLSQQIAMLTAGERS